ncbi:tigger transposable element-derived protein 2-like [Schistocerca gregaria]|uniref:tigger transposable element-derived protein 2-like n=1 Tax=Schistocerca gregaria TaxID=7010 RepID=UPI00211DBD2B|nr:tigger transposable element-derived protein 2-like [Schistocerca gregaria]
MMQQRSTWVSLKKMIREGKYSPQQIYNAVETGLNFWALPTKNLASKSEDQAPGFKMCKDCVTLLVCSNAANDKVFKEWFHGQFVPSVRWFSKENHLSPRAILLVDKVPSHPNTEELCDGEIVVKFLAPNVTSLLQPMDQSLLQTLKLIYRKQFLRMLIQDDTIPLVDKIKKTNVKDVVYWAAEDNLVENEEENLLLMIQTIPGCEGDVDEWMAADETCVESLTDVNLVAAVTQDQEEVDCCDGSGNELERDKGELVPHSDAAGALHLALYYLEQQPTATPADLMFMR